tara:strand:- start:286 stop:486 length:201 start_codon:yes stop_codon:yes gene_type:complete
MTTLPSNIQGKIRNLKYEKKSYQEMLNNPKEFPVGVLKGKVETSYELAKRKIDQINNEIVLLKQYK